jgi:hypothetical protein
MYGEEARAWERLAARVEGLVRFPDFDRFD